MKMKVTVIGKEKMKGVSRKTDRPFDGSIVHMTFRKAGCEGIACDSTYIDANLRYFEEINVGKVYDLDRDGRGYIVDFSEVQK